MVPRLPPELIDAIVGHVSTSDKDTLKACAVTGSVFRATCQRRLWRELELTNNPHNDGYSYSYLQAATRFAAYPHLASYVAELELWLCVGDDMDTAESVFHALPSVLSILSKLAAIDIRLYYTQMDTVWPNLPAGFTTAVAELLARPPASLRKLRMSDFLVIPREVMHSALMACPTVTLFRVSADDFSTRTSVPESWHKSPIERLKTSIYQLCRPFLSLTVLPYTKSLRALVLCNSGGNVMYELFTIPALCASLAESLEYLAIEFPCMAHSDNVSYSPVIVLPPLPKLRYLQLSFHYIDYTAQGPAVSVAPALSPHNAGLVPLFLANSLPSVPALATLVLPVDVRVRGLRMKYEPPAAFAVFDSLISAFLAREATRNRACYIPKLRFFPPLQDEAKARAGLHMDAFARAMREAHPLSVPLGLAVVERDREGWISEMVDF
ncbi:ULP-PROTEASE domain-containing protein [Mycena indigotica]|uniref:ULP-PROTEASE domain-containing protein n=1 Tax=Mycena indigotica TaxID=2126181 RepID=A0A8H6SLP1_9AGAR|nr:ULP-PROTEASE domain-containing protein [Mycena indigotica]KAF7300926.1 ULP-PROTEASE domain-containing protein [Mycena indigotica]